MVKGHEAPRIYTPPLRELTPETTLGFDVIDFSENVLNLPLLPWERWLFIHALEIVGDFDGDWHFRFRTVIVLVARQNGKTFVSNILALYFLYILCVALVIGTAQSLDQAEDTWEAAVEMAQSNPSLDAEITAVRRTNGGKRLILTDNRRYRVKAASRRAGRGQSGDLVLLDELREHQTWDAWGALTKTVMARANALIWCMSNAGDATSIVLRHLRIQAHKALGDPDGIVKAIGDALGENESEIDDDSLGLFEWSASPDKSITDREGWAQANPSLGYTITERAIRAACATDTEEVFRTECLCQWVTAIVQPPFPVGSWDMGRDERSEIAPDSPLWYGVDVSGDRRNSAIAVCGMRADGCMHAEIAAYGPGMDWLKGWFQERASGRPMNVALQGRGAPISSIADTLAAIDGVNVIECVGKDVAAWTGRFYDGVAACDPDGESDALRIYHRSQPVLDLAANVAQTKSLGDSAFAFDRQSSKEDISALIAAVMAHGAATSPDTAPRSAYEEEGHGLLVV